MSDRSKQIQADWISWTLQYFLGLAVGAASAWAFIVWARSEMRLPGYPAWMMEFCLGGGLFLAGLAAFYGDNIWNKIFDMRRTTQGHRHSKRSARLAALSFVLGIGIMIAVVMKWTGIVA